MATTQTKSPNLLRNWTWLSKIISSNLREYVSKYTCLFMLKSPFFHMFFLSGWKTVQKTVYVRPHLEYAQAVWAPYLAKYVNMLEKVQIRATKLIDGFKNVEYSDRLRRLNLPTLTYRRARGDLIELYKHFLAYDKETLTKSFKPRDRLSRKHTFQLIPNSSKDGNRGVQKSSFYHRIIDKWNELPEYVVNGQKHQQL